MVEWRCQHTRHLNEWMTEWINKSVNVVWVHTHMSDLVRVKEASITNGPLKVERVKWRSSQRKDGYSLCKRHSVVYKFYWDGVYGFIQRVRDVALIFPFAWFLVDRVSDHSSVLFSKCARHSWVWSPVYAPCFLFSECSLFALCTAAFCIIPTEVSSIEPENVVENCTKEVVNTDHNECK
jgi:hypothetical protein